MTERSANVVWNGDLLHGAGTIAAAPSGAFGPLDVTWASRAEDPDGRTSPEELLASAWAACFAMALSNGLANAGTPADRLETSATVAFQPGEGIVRGKLTVRGSVPGIDGDAFHRAADDAAKNCPVSKALSGIPDVSFEATLA
jgi:osmotically inducible protein OsmC